MDALVYNGGICSAALEAVVARNGGALIEGGATFATRRGARQVASEFAGYLGLEFEAIRMKELIQVDVPFGPKNSNRVIGRRSADGLRY